MTTFVLVHGGGHGGWCWKWTAAALRRAGHDVHTPTLTGFGERSHLAEFATSFGIFVQDVVSVVRFEDLHDVVLVGHSMGGTVIPRVAEEVPDRIRSVVWLTAAVCADGETLLDAVPPSPWIADAVTVQPDGSVSTDPERILAAVIHDGTADQQAFVRQRHLPYPPHALVEPGRLSAFLGLGLPTGYVIAAEDRTIEPAVQARLADRLPNSRRSEVRAGHDCMIVRPTEVAGALSEVSR
ncbi:MAG TPA: alpha/beta hydrolase [Acidimicrobiales bacterium]|nr:alpha/beta hydrolase [Acidimicrobiales bacterium]